MPLLYRHLQQHCPQQLPTSIREQLHDEFHEHALANLFLTGELVKLLKLLDAHKIRAVPYKGPALAAQLYANVAMRQFGDLDLLVRPHDIWAARDVLLAQGYRLWLPLALAQETAQLHSFGVLPLEHEARKLAVELHTEVVPRGFAFPLDTGSLWDRLESVDLGGSAVRALAAEDLLLILCAHGSKHQWSSLGWICDVAELIRVRPGIGWPRVQEQARVLRSQRMLDLGLSLASTLLEAPIPPDIAARLATDRVVDRLATDVRHRLFLDPEPPPGNLETVLFHLRAREHLCDGIRPVLSMILAPTPAEWMLLSLPAGLAWLYYLLRPLRLGSKYGRLLIEHVRRWAASRSQGESERNADQR